MQIRKFEQNTNPNFQRLYMPSRTILRKYGTKFATNAEHQRAQLQEFAKKYDIYVVPRQIGQDSELLESICNKLNFSKEQREKMLPKENYFNVHIAPYHCREINNHEKRNALGENIFSALGVESDNLITSVRKILADKQAVGYLDELTKYYRTLS